jgi:cell division protein FtsL
MTRLNLVLLVLLIASSLYLVHTSYESRRLFAAIDRARGEERQLEIEFKRLDAERQAQGTNARVEKVARERLHMRTATPAVTHYVVDGAASGATP